MNSLTELSVCIGTKSFLFGIVRLVDAGIIDCIRMISINQLLLLIFRLIEGFLMIVLC